MIQSSRVPTNDMDPSIQNGDLIWTKKKDPQRGDVVLIRDPHDPNRRYLRRVMAIEGEYVRPLPNGSLQHNGKTLRQRDMGSQAPFRIFQESTWSDNQEPIQYLVQRLIDAPRANEQIERRIPEAHIYVMADNRDKAIDSRWWGPIPTSLVIGVVSIQAGPAHPWRGWINWHH
jgi:signal peptidase I